MERLTKQRGLRDERGAALVEFAIVSVIFLTLVFGAISYGMIFSAKHSLTNAASEGARAVLKMSPLASDADKITMATNKATDAAKAGLGSKGVYLDAVAAAIDTCASDTTQRCITVTVTYPYSAHPLVPAMPLLNFLPSSIKSTAVVELSS